MDADHAVEQSNAAIEELVFSLEGADLSRFQASWSQASPLGFAASLISALCRAAPALTWRQTYGLADLDAGFLRKARLDPLGTFESRGIRA